MKKEKAICIFAYNRCEHLSTTLNALLQNDVSAFDVHIFQDGPKDESDSIETSEVTELIKTYQQKYSITFRNSTSNLGLANSVFNGLNLIFDEYKKAIILEDDIAVRAEFLPFLTQALDIYEDNDKVAGVAGFSYISESMRTNYFLPIGTSWGWATWDRSWAGMRNDPSFYLNQIEKSNNAHPFNFGTYPFKEMLIKAVDKKVDSWAIQFYAHFYLREQYFLFPSMSLCSNNGFDNSGTHTGESMEGFNSKKVGSILNGLFPEATLDKVITKKLKEHMQKMAQHDWKSKFRRNLKKIIG